MPNEIAASNMATDFDDIIEGADIKTGVSKSLEIYRKDDEEWQQANGKVWIPETYNFESSDGMDSTGNGEDVIDRMIPVNLAKKRHIKVVLGADSLRDGRLTTEAKKGLSREIKNAVDIACFEEIINRSTIIVRKTGDFVYGDAVRADLALDDAGLTGYDRKLILSTPHYGEIAETLGTSAYKDTTNLDAFAKLQIPPVAGFESMKADYRKNLAGLATNGLTVNGNQSHTVATYTDADQDNYQDNSQMTFNVTGATPANLPVGSKINIAGVNALHPSTREDIGSLRTFTAQCTANGVVTISPAIIIAGASRNCTAQAADTVAITVLNTDTAAPSVFFTEGSVFLVPGRMPDVSESKNVAFESMVLDNGIPVRFSYWYDGDTEALTIKVLVFFDVVVTCPERVGIILTNQT